MPPEEAVYRVAAQKSKMELVQPGNTSIFLHQWIKKSLRTGSARERKHTLLHFHSNSEHNFATCPRQNQHLDIPVHFHNSKFIAEMSANRQSEVPKLRFFQTKNSELNAETPREKVPLPWHAAISRRVDLQRCAEKNNLFVGWSAGHYFSQLFGPC